MEDLEEVFGWGNGAKVLKGKFWVLGLVVEQTKKVCWIIL